MSIESRRWVLSVPLLAVFFAGCSVTPTKIAPEQYREQVDLDLAAMFVEQF